MAVDVTEGIQGAVIICCKLQAASVALIMH